jgi:hypothetical protein
MAAIAVSPTPNRLLWADVARGLCIVLVVMIPGHFDALVGRPPACGEIEIIQHSSLCRQREAHFSNTSSACASRAEPTSARRT